MAIVKMKRLRLIGMLPERERLLEQLQRLGCVEIDPPRDRLADPEWAALLASPDSAALAAAKEEQGAVKSALAILQRYVPAKSSLLAPRPQVREGQLADRAARDRALELAGRLNELEKQMGACRAEQEKCSVQKAALAPWLELDVPLETTSTREVIVQFGTVGANVTREELEGALAAATDLAQITWAGRDRELQYFLFLCHKSVEEETREILKQYGFARAALRGWTGTARENDQRLDQELARLEWEEQAARDAVVQMGDRRAELELCLDAVSQEVAREEARTRLMDTQATFFLEGWCPDPRLGEVEEALKSYVCAWETAEPTEEEYPKVPVKLKNNPLTRCMNVITEMYSLPAYDGIDPNPLMAPFFIVFFGMMMADMGYGILMVAASLVVLFKTKPRPGTRNFMELIFLCGISTFVWGAMTGGFFGDFIPQLLRIINPESTFEMPALFTPLTDTIAILLGSLVLGAIQVFTGMLISVVRKIQAGEFIDALFDEITWWIILAGTALAIFGLGSVAGVPVVLVAGALMLVLGGTRKAKGIGKVTSLVGLVYNGVTGFFSDILSYMRLMALMLAGSVIAQVFNTLGSVFGNVVVFVIISMIGNALNLALNLLGCYVHDLRLQCLEYFNRFYKEGGRPFKPLNIDTKYVDILKEEH